LPGGTYTLQIKGSNEDGVWNKKGYSLEVEVVPAFWQTLKFQVGVGLVLIGLILVFYLVRDANQKANTRVLERQVKERTIEIERLFEKTKELAVVEERNRLARELHDSAKQKAFAALAQMGTANGILPESPKKALLHLQEAETLVYEVIEELTFLIQEMYPIALKEKGLAASLRDYVFEWEARTEIQVDLVIKNEQHLPIDIDQAFYRSTQEALSNIARHSQAKQVKIRLEYLDDEIVEEIYDNGRGFDPQTRPTGMGLRSIRERIEKLGGSVKIDSTPEQGTSLLLTVPLKPQEMREGEKND
jgi:signal transduction histidine kinase